MNEEELRASMLEAVRDLLGGEDMCPYTDEVLAELAEDFVQIAMAYGGEE